MGRKMSKEEAVLSNYIEMTLYNKTKEIENKIALGDVSEHEQNRYKNVFRTELKVRNAKLNSNKSKGIKISKSLNEYYNSKTTTELYNSYAPRIFRNK